MTAALESLLVVSLEQAVAKDTPDVLTARLGKTGTVWTRLSGVYGLSRHSRLRGVTVETSPGPVRWDGEEQSARHVPDLGTSDAVIRAEFQ